MKPIAIFYHGLFFIGNPPRQLPNAPYIMDEQIARMVESDLWGMATQIHFGINGGEESVSLAQAVIPSKASVTYHGLQCRTENRTVETMLQWSKSHIGWNILYLHSKGASHDPRSGWARFVAKPWRDDMMEDLVDNWLSCIIELLTHDIVCTVWLWNQGSDGSQHIAAGNFLWVRSDFAAQLPSLFLRDRIIRDGLDSIDSRYEAEVAFGNGPRPRVMQFRPDARYWQQPQFQ